MGKSTQNIHTTGLLDEAAAARYLDLSPKALQNWRAAGDGPVFVRISSRCIRYEPEKLMEFIEARRKKSTSEA